MQSRWHRISSRLEAEKVSSVRSGRMSGFSHCLIASARVMILGGYRRRRGRDVVEVVELGVKRGVVQRGWIEVYLCFIPVTIGDLLEWLLAGKDKLFHSAQSSCLAMM